MNAFIEFIKEYWFQLVTVSGFVFEIIFIFIKRKPKSIDDFKLALGEVLAFVPQLIISCERPGEGSSKKNEVINLAIVCLASKLGRKLTDNEIAILFGAVSEQVETVLCTPTKKEKVYE